MVLQYDNLPTYLQLWRRGIDAGTGSVDSILCYIMTLEITSVISVYTLETLGRPMPVK